jgi:sugar phosphate isomerase/epimerase
MRLGAAMDIRFAASVAEFMAYVSDLGLDHVEFKQEYLAGHPSTPTPERIGELADEHGLSLTFHAPFRDWNIGSYDERVRTDSVERVKRSLDAAATAGAGAVVVHGGSVPERYPGWVHEQSAENAIESLEACADHAARVGVPLCLENQPPSDEDRRYTTSPDDLAATLDAVDADPDVLGVTLDVGHAKVAGTDWRAFVDRFGDRIEVCHLHDNDGTDDQHEPLHDYEEIVAELPASYGSFEMKRVADVAASLGVDHRPIDPSLTHD